MRSLSLHLALALVGLSYALPVAQQAATGQGDQRFLGNLIGAAQGAWQGLTQPQQFNNNFGFGYPVNTNQFGGGYGGVYNQGGFNGGYGGGYNQGYGGGYNNGYGGGYGGNIWG